MTALTTVDGRNFPLNTWYVAATSRSVGDGLVATRVADIPMLLVRGADGAVAALEDRSSHRPYPLSRGRREGDLIVSGFDGWVYDLSGACVLVPTQPHVPLNAAVRTFPVTDDGTFVFVWPGNRAMAALRPPPRSSFDNPAWTAAGGMLDVAANYLLLHEIFADVTHVPFVHPEVAPPALRTPTPQLQVQVSETSVSFTREYPRAGLQRWHAEAADLPVDGEYPQRERGTFVSPGLWVERWEVVHDNEVSVLGFTQAPTPVTASASRLYWWISRNTALDRADVTESVRSAFTEYYRRVADVAETMQRVIDTDGARVDVNVSADVAALQVRTIVNTLVREESATAPHRRRARRTANL